MFLFTTLDTTKYLFGADEGFLEPPMGGCLRVKTHWLVTATVDGVGLQYVLQDIVLIWCHVQFILPLALVPQGCYSPSTTCSLVL